MRDEQYESLLACCRAVRGNRYEVREGMLPWPEFPFDVHQFGMSVEVVEEDDEATPAMAATVQITLLTRMPDNTKSEVNNRVLNEMRQDTRDICELLAQAARSDGQSSVFLSVHKEPSITIGDTKNKLQGITRTLILEY